MKTVHISIVTAAALLVSSAFAQGTVKVGHQQAPAVQQRGGHDLTKRALHMAIEEINKGLKELREGLPIYQGHRANAIDLGVLAKSEILTGLMEQRLDNQNRAKAQAQTDNANPKGYTDQQIKNSNIRLVIGGHHFENAIGILNRTEWNYENHKVKAVNDLQRALEELKIALGPYGGPQANMPKGGFKDTNRRGKGVILP